MWFHRVMTAHPPRRVTKEWVKEVLRVVHLSLEDEEKLLSLDYPVDLEELARTAQPLGVSHDWLVSRMGGSP